MSGILPKMSGARMLYEKAPEAMGVSGMIYKEQQREKEKRKARDARTEKRALLQEDELKLTGE